MAGTLIKTENGNVPIEELEPGDVVYAKDTETGEEGYKEVVRLFVSQKDTLVHITIGDEQIDTTTEHPFWVDGKGFVEAQELSVDDNVLTADGELKTITNVTTEQLDSPVTVYNFEVKDWHTYYVSEEEILVHNECGVAGESGSNSSKIFWGKWEDYGHVSIGNNEYAEVGNRLYTRHAVARMQPSGMRYTNASAGGKVKASRIINAGELDYGRSISPNYIEDIINTGKTSTQEVDNVIRTVFSSGTVDIITEQDGRIVITILTH